MAMLAEPRRRQKLSFDPRNKAWTEDTTKFGQKLMEKMGWSKGKGLGVKEDGNLSHVKVSLKNNNLGIGCKASQEDNWIAHQDDFNDLLSTLNEGRTPSTSTQREALGLEERSQQSRGKVRYKKFTRGKDLTKYGKEGMDSILGRRLTSSAPVTPQTQSVENSDDEESEDKELTHGVITIKSSRSVSDYFAQKMSALKRPKRRQESESHSDTELQAPRCGFGFRESMDQSQRSNVEVAGPSRALDRGNEDGGNEGEEEQEELESEEGAEGSQRNRNKKKKKRKKKKAAARDSDEENDEQIEVRGESDIEEDEGIDLGRKKKKNKKKKRLVDESKSESASEHNESNEKKKKKKTKKSKKDKNRDEPGCSHDDDTAEYSEERSSGETSKRKRESSEEGLDEERAETSSGKKKRKKTNREDGADSVEAPSTSTKKKKKKKQKI